MAKTRKRVYISHRGGSSTPYARQVFDELSQRLGADRVFYEVDAPEPGTDLTDVIDEHLDETGLMLVVMDPTWADGASAKGDSVGLEISHAMERDLMVVPVLVGGAKMPNASTLPTPLKPLVRRQAHELGDTHWSADMDALVVFAAKALDVRRVKPARDRGSGTGARRVTAAGSATGAGLSRIPDFFRAHRGVAAALAGLALSLLAFGTYQLVKPTEEASTDENTFTCIDPADGTEFTVPAQNVEGIEASYGECTPDSPAAAEAAGVASADASTTDVADGTVESIESVAEDPEPVTPTTTTDADPGSSSPRPAGSSTDFEGGQCPPGITVGGTASCAFAAVIAREYRAHPATTITKRSPATGNIHTVTCEAGSPVVCTTSTNSTIYFDR